MTKRQRQDAAAAELKAVKTESRICFGIAWFATEEDADRYAEIVRRRGDTYNGGYFHGMPCGRARQFDHEVGRRMLYAVTTR